MQITKKIGYFLQDNSENAYNDELKDQVVNFKSIIFV